MADHLRPWKQVQRQFQSVEREKLEAAEKQKLEEQKAKYQKQIDEIDAKIQAADADAETRGRDLRSIDNELKVLEGRTEKIDTRRRFQKAALDSKRSLYDGMIDRGEEREARAYLNTVVQRGRARARRPFARAGEGARRTLTAKKAEKEKLLGFVDDLKKEKERLTREADRVTRVIEQKDALYGGPLHWYSQADGVPAQPSRHRHHAADQDPAAQPPRADDQLQFQGSAALRPLRDLPPGDRPHRLRQGRARRGRWPRFFGRIPS